MHGLPIRYRQSRMPLPFRQNGMVIPRRKVLSVPGVQNNRRKIGVKSAGKAPKMRFQPGNFFRFRGGLYEIVYAFRLQQTLNVWYFCLEAKKSFREVEPDDTIGNLLVAAGYGAKTPRVVHDLFRTSMEAMEFFSDIPAHGDRVYVSTQTLLKEGELLSSGPQVSP